MLYVKFQGVPTTGCVATQVYLVQGTTFLGCTQYLCMVSFYYTTQEYQVPS